MQNCFIGPNGGFTKGKDIDKVPLSVSCAKQHSSLIPEYSLKPNKRIIALPPIQNCEHT